MSCWRFVGKEGLGPFYRMLLSDAEKSPGDPPVFDTRDIFGQSRQVWIRHGESLYRLMITRQGKLILNK
jgi:hemin uptake protein HemP